MHRRFEQSASGAVHRSSKHLFNSQMQCVPQMHVTMRQFLENWLRRGHAWCLCKEVITSIHGREAANRPANMPDFLGLQVVGNRAEHASWHSCSLAMHLTILKLHRLGGNALSILRKQTRTCLDHLPIQPLPCSHSALVRDMPMTSLLLCRGQRAP